MYIEAHTDTDYIYLDMDISYIHIFINDIRIHKNYSKGPNTFTEELG